MFDKKIDWNMWLAFSTVLLFFATAALVKVGFLQYSTMEKELSTAKISAEVSKKYVSLVEQQLEVQKQEFELVNHPIIQPIGNPTGGLKDGSIIFQNLGNLPPDNVSVVWEFRTLEDNTPALYKNNKETPYFDKGLNAGKWFAVEYDSGITETQNHCFLIVGWAFSKTNKIESDSITYAWHPTSKTWYPFPVYKRKNLEEAHRIFLNDKQEELKEIAKKLCSSQH